MRNPSTVALHNTHTPQDLSSASISLFNHTDTLPPHSFKPPTSFTSTPRRQPLPLLVAPFSLHLLLLAGTPPPPAPPSASHFQTASGVTRGGLRRRLSRSDSLVSAPSMRSVGEMSSRWKWRLLTGGSSETIMDEWLEAATARCLSVHRKKHLVRRLESDSRLGFRQVTAIDEPAGRGGKRPTNRGEVFASWFMCVSMCESGSAVDINNNQSNLESARLCETAFG